MFYNALLATAPALGLAVYCLAHLIACRCFRGTYGPLIGSFFPGMLAATVATLLGARGANCAGLDAAGYLALNLATYGALGWGYFHFVNMNIASLRIRMLYELAEAGGSLPKTALLARYNNEQMVSVRLQRLVGGGHLVQRQGRFYSGKRHFLYAARFFDALRWLILGRGAGGLGRIPCPGSMNPCQPPRAPTNGAAATVLAGKTAEATS